jgi:capsular polysaccharide biosynthesis protein
MYEDIFVKREGAIRRICKNQKVLEEYLPNSYRPIDCSNLGFIDQFLFFYNARRVLGIHGAALTNIIFCKNLEYLYEFKDPRDDDLIFEAISTHSLGATYKVSYGTPINDR